MLANGSPFYHFLMLFYPIIVIIPAAFSYIYDQDCNEQVFILSRAGKINYYLAKMAATFWTTFLAFSIPFLTEIILNCIVFPGKAAGLLSNVSKYQIPELEAVHKLLLPSVYSYSICIYVIIFTVMFGIASGILATFALAVSIAIKLKYKAFLFLPVYILVYILNEMSDIIPQINFSTNYYFYFDIFNITAKSFIGYLMCLLSIAGLSIVLVVYKARKDSI
ncbi:hypothetical protein [Anaeromicropila populeti]|uniref:hypothetical protein n=1 Tax=Anaeromicropila populeti TaxID=37658 RepID=UPI0011606132|nr:hypothetical protein [Anaeromicropila populeti]